MVPNAEHWRTALWEAQEIQAGIMGYLPGYATPRLVCDVPLLGKMWVHQVAEYDRELGVSRWRANDWAARTAPTTDSRSTTTRSTRCPRPVRLTGAPQPISETHAAGAR